MVRTESVTKNGDLKTVRTGETDLGRCVRVGRVIGPFRDKNTPERTVVKEEGGRRNP